MTSPRDTRDVHLLRRSTDGCTLEPVLYDLCISASGDRCDEVRRPNVGGSKHADEVTMSKGLGDDDVSDACIELVHFTSDFGGRTVVEAPESDAESTDMMSQLMNVRRNNLRCCPDVSMRPSIGHAVTSLHDFRRQQRHLNNTYHRTNDVIKSCVKTFDVRCGYFPVGNGLATQDNTPMAMKNNVITSSAAPSTPLWQSIPWRPPLPPSAHRDVIAANARQPAIDPVRPFILETIDHPARRPTNIPTTTTQASYFDYFQLDRWIGIENEVFRRLILNSSRNATPEIPLIHDRRISDDFQHFNYCSAPQSARDSNEKPMIQTTHVDEEYLMDSPLHISCINNRDTAKSTGSFVERSVLSDIDANGRSNSSKLSSSDDVSTLLVNPLSALAFYEYLLQRYNERERSPDSGTISSKYVIASPNTCVHRGADNAPTAPRSVVTVNCLDNESAAGPGHTLFRPYLDLLPQSSTVEDITRTDTIATTPSTPSDSVDGRSTKVAMSSTWLRHQRRRTEPVLCGLMTSQTTAHLRSKRYTCDLCGQTFSRSNTLVTHRVRAVCSLYAYTIE